jgi:hypothetical protein
MSPASGGTTVHVPGFFMDSLRVTTNGGPITWTHVPVLVLEHPRPAWTASDSSPAYLG